MPTSPVRGPDPPVSDPGASASACLTLAALADLIPRCVACPRLVTYCHGVGQVKVRRFSHEDYWSRPVAGFGDERARILIVGLAPGAHGANRTGRVFTGDRSGDFLFAALHRAGLSSQASSLHRADGMRLSSVYITAALRCAPPANKPAPAELAACSPYLLRELALLPDLRVVVALGAIGHKGFLTAYRRHHSIAAAQRSLPFSHGAEHVLRGDRGQRLTLLDSYHVSQQNTFTGRLTPAMFDAILGRAKALAAID